MDSSSENLPQGATTLPAPASPAASRPGLSVRVFQNTTAVLGGRVVSLVFSAGTSILLARYLGRERLGEYGAIYAYLSLYGFFATFCLEQILVREVSLRREQAAQLFHTATLTSFGFSLFGAALAPLLSPLFGYSGPLRWLIVMAAIDVLILPPFKLPGIIFQVDMRNWYIVALGLFRQALWLLAVILLAFKSAAFYQVIVARTCCSIVEGLVLLYTLHCLGLLQGRRRFLPDEARRMLRDGFPLVFTVLAVGIYHRIDQVMLHKISGDQVLGPYVIAVQLTELFSTLPSALMGSLFPALCESVSDAQRFDRYLRESYRFLLVIVFAACAIITPIATPLVELFYGKQFLTTAPLLIVLMWSEVPIFFASVLGSSMIAKNLQRYMPASSAAGAVANVLINLWAIPRYGALGACWATVASYCISDILFLSLFSGVRPSILLGVRIALPPFLLALAITFTLHFIPTGFWWKLVFAALIYFFGAWLSGSIHKGDLAQAKAMIKDSFR